MDVMYRTTANATGGRDGHAALADGTLAVKFTAPKEIGGPGGEGNNPEQLFACGYSACFLGAIQFVASQEGVSVPEDARVSATVGLGKRDDGKGFGIDVDLLVSLPGVDQAQARNLVEKAHTVCPYSHATKGNVDVRTSIA